MNQQLVGALVGAAISGGGLLIFGTFQTQKLQTKISDFAVENAMLRDSIAMIDSSLHVNTLVIDSLELHVEELEARETTIIKHFDNVRTTINDATVLELDSIIRAAITGP